jgi:hypothetical protein
MKVRFKLRLKSGKADLEVKSVNSKLLLRSRRMLLPTELMLRKLKKLPLPPIPRLLLLKLTHKLLQKEP